MAIIGETIQQFDIHVLLRGERAVTRMKYFPSVPGAFATNAEAAIAWVGSIQVPWLAVTSPQAVLEKIEVRNFGPNSGAPHIEFIGSPGTGGAGDVMTPWDAYSGIKVPDNSQIEGTDLTPFRNGGMRLMGIPEQWQDAGELVPFALTALDALAVALRLLTISTAGGPIDYIMYLERPDPVPGNPPVSAAPVSACGFRNVLTSQVTRRYT